MMLGMAGRTVGPAAMGANMNENQIVIYRCGGWVADMSHALGAADIRRLFGSTHLPLPYAASDDGQRVRARIAGLNPDAIVWLRDQ